MLFYRQKTSKRDYAVVFALAGLFIGYVAALLDASMQCGIVNGAFAAVCSAHAMPSPKLALTIAAIATAVPAMGTGWVFGSFVRDTEDPELILAALRR
jgi:hypothetical protein